MRVTAKMIALICLATAFLAAAQSRGAQKSPAPPGKLVDLGGHRLHVHCTGKGDLAVVVENGLGDFSFDWILVQERVEKFARICTYDRGGYAWSDPGPKPRTYAQLNLELHDALSRLGEREPLILVGHSYGGGVVRNYASKYPSDVAGMVLVDIVHEDERIPMGPKHAGRVREDAKGLAIPAARENMLPSDAPKLEVGDAGEFEPPSERLPQNEQRLHAWAERLPVLEDAEESQREWSAESMALMHAKPQDGALGTRPLVVLTRAKGGYGNDLDVPAEELEAERLRLQSQLVLLSSKGKQVIVQSGHNMHLEAPDAIVDAIRVVVSSCRQMGRAQVSR